MRMRVVPSVDLQRAAQAWCNRVSEGLHASVTPPHWHHTAATTQVWQVLYFADTSRCFCYWSELLTEGHGNWCEELRPVWRPGVLVKGWHHTNADSQLPQCGAWVELAHACLQKLCGQTFCSTATFLSSFQAGLAKANGKAENTFLPPILKPWGQRTQSSVGAVYPSKGPRCCFPLGLLAINLALQDVDSAGSWRLFWPADLLEQQALGWGRRAEEEGWSALVYSRIKVGI